MPSPTRPLLLLSDIFPPKTGGSGRWFWEVYSRLPRDAVRVAAGTDPRAAAFDAGHDLRTHRLPLGMATRGVRSLPNLRHYLRTAWRVAELIDRERVGVVHCGRNLPEGFVAYLVRRLRGTPYLCYAHGEDIGVSATSRELAWMTRRVFAGASLVVANSRNTRAMLLDDWKLPPAKAALLHPGVDTERFAPAPRDAAARAALGWAGRTVLLTVGRLQKRKGHDHLIRGLKAIAARHPTVLYAIVGDGDEGPALRALAEAEGVAGHVQFLGETDDATLLRCYQQCDLFVLPNRAVGRDVEGFGMVLLEAQACGKPVLAGASGGTTEAMDAPRTGRLVPCDTPGPPAEAIADLLADPPGLAAMGAAGRAWVREHFDWGPLTRQAWELFQAVPGR